jgi:hypothetical protein
MIKVAQKKSNPMAREVRTPKYRQRIVKNKMVYDRKDNIKWSPTDGLLKMLDDIKIKY